MRWKGIIFLVTIIFLAFILSWIFTSKIVENEMENLGTTIVGAKVEIDDLEFSLTDLYIRWSKLQVTDPDNTMKNLLETGQTEFDFGLIPLLSGKVIIDNIQISDVQSGTDRETDGAIGRDEHPEENSFIASTVNSLREEVSTPIGSQISSLQQNINVDSILKILEIESITKMKNLQEDLSGKYSSWETRLNQVSIVEDARIVEQKVKSLDVNKAKTIEGFQQTINDIDAIKSMATKIENQVSEAKNKLTEDLSSAHKDLNQIDDWIKQDYSRALAKANLAEMNTEHIGKLIFGSKLVDQITQYLGYIGMARSYSEKYSTGDPEKQDPPRYKGQDIYFSGQNIDPDFWIKKMSLSGKTGQNLNIAGDLSNLVSNQKLIGKPTEINIKSLDNQATSFNLSGLFNYIDSEPGEKIQLSYAGFSLADTKLSDSGFLPNKINSGLGKVSANLSLLGETIDGEVKFSGSSLKFENLKKSESGNSFEGIVHSIIGGINYVDFKARITGSQDNIKFSLNSNLDKIFADRLKNIAGEKINEARARIKSEIENRIKSQQIELNTYVSTQETQLNSKIKEYEEIVSANNKLVDEKKKEVEIIFENEKSNIKDKVQDLFKF